MSYNGGLINIGLFASETSHFRNTNWADCLQSMDQIWVINPQQEKACVDSGVDFYRTPIWVVPHALDIQKFQQSYSPLEQLKGYAGEFIFYGIGEWVARKNWAALVKAFHLEFRPEEPVHLLLKVGVPGLDRDASAHHIRKELDAIKLGLKLGVYKPEILITDKLSEAQMLRLHASCNCYVSSSYGEAANIGGMVGLAMGKTPIVPNHSGFATYIDDSVGWLVDCREEPCFGATDSLGDLYVGNENWWAIDINHLRRCLREAYENRNLVADKSSKGILKSYDFSYESIGCRMRDILTNAHEKMARRTGPVSLVGTGSKAQKAI